MHRSLWLRAVARSLFGRRSLSLSRKQRSASRRVRVGLEPLEDRVTPSTTINVNDPSGGLDNPTNVTVSTLGSNVTLRDAINAANNTGGTGSYVINLPAGNTITFNAVDNNSIGPNALPAITSNITIEGNGDTLKISGATERFFFVGSALTLDNLTLTGGVAQGSNGRGGGAGVGGAIVNFGGKLTLDGDTLTSNKALGGNGATGSGTGSPTTFGGGKGGGGFGGGGGGLGGAIYSQGGSLTITNSTLSGNTAQGGNGGGTGAVGGSGYGGAICNAFGTATLVYTTIANNSVINGTSGSGSSGNGNANGGGVYNYAVGSNGAATLTLDNSVIGQDQNNGGSDLVNNGNGPTATVNGSSSAVQSVLQIGNSTVVGGAITVTSAPNLATSLANNGGMTETLAPNSGSPLIGAGSASIPNLPNVDQRGLGRPGSSSSFKPDIGAFQTQSTTTSVTNVTTPYNTAGQTITLTATVDAFGDPNQPAAEGKVTFTLAGTGLSSVSANIVNGVASTTINLPSTIHPNNYSIDAAYTDPNTPSLYNSSSGIGTLALTPASTSMTVATTNSPITYNSGGETLDLQANVTSSGGTINEGNIVFTVNGVSSPAIAVSGGIATDVLTLPASSVLASGNYPSGVSATYTDTTTNNFASVTATGDVAVNAANSTTTITSTNVSTTFNSTTPQTVSLTATVTSSNGGIVNEGHVTFTVTNPNGTNLTATSGTVTNGTATATLTVPANFKGGTYSFSAAYSDAANNYLPSNSTNTGTLTVNAANTTTSLTTTSVSTTFNSTTPQNVTLSASVTSSNGGTVNEGTVTFTVVNPHGNNVTATASVSGGTASVILPIPVNFPVGSYTVNASYTDAADYLPSTASPSGTLTVNTANTTTTLTSTLVKTVYNSTTPQTVTLTANVTSGNGGTVNEGAVTFTVTNPNGPDLTVSGNVSNGTATATLTVPAGFAAGAYTIHASYADTINVNGLLNYNPSTSATTGLLNVQMAVTTTIISNNVSSSYNSTVPQTVTLVAAVKSVNGGTVNEGNVTFTVTNPNGANLTAIGNVSNGIVSATLTVPAGFLAGTYSFNASYVDTPNPNGTTNYAPSTSAVPGTLTVNSTTTVTKVASASGTFNSQAPQTVTLSASITTFFGNDTINEGTVTFTVTNPNIAPLTATANVTGGTATATVTLPAGFPAGTYTIEASYVDPNNANGVPNYEPSKSTDIFGANGTLTIKAATTQTTLVTNAVTSTYNSATPQTVSLTATVISNNGGTVNEGAVTFTIAGTSLMASGNVINNVATATLALPAGFLAGSYALDASYADTLNVNGVVNYNASTATPGTLTVNAAATTTTIVKTPVTSTYNSGTAQTVTVDATVTSPNGGPVNEGNVTFTVVNPNGANVTATGAVTGGTATATLTLPAGFLAGSYTVDAAYADSTNANGVVNYAASTATPGTLMVNAAPTTTTINPLNVTATFNSTTPQTVQLKADVASPTGGTVNEGNVTFTVVNAVYGNLTASAPVINGVATAILTIPAGYDAGVFPFSASYVDTTNANGVVNYLPSTSTTPGTLTINPASTVTTLTSTSVTSTYNSIAPQTVTLSATVISPNGGTVNEGTVTFTVINPNGANLTAVSGAVTNGTATATLSVPAGFAAGTYTINAAYTDAGNYLPSTSATTGTLTVTTATTQTSLLTTAVSSIYNSITPQTVTLSATVTSGNGGIVNEGAVTFTIKGAALTATANVTNDVATTTLTLPAGFAAGTYAINASYVDPNNANGVPNYSPSSAATPGTLTVNAANTTTTVTSTSVTSVYNSTTAQTVTLTASVASSNGGPVNEGNITFIVTNSHGANLTATGTVSNGTASATLTVPAGFLAGSYAFSANYTDTTNANGVVNYNPSSSGAVGTLTVQTAATQTTIATTPVTSTYNSTTPQTVTLTANVTSGDGGIVNEGLVTFTLSNPNGPNLTATGSVTNGTATATLTVPAGFPAGSYSFSASYTDPNNANGVPNYAPSTAPASGILTVNAAATTTTLTTTSAVILFGNINPQPVTLSATVTSAGGTVNEGNVTFTVVNPSGPNLTATGTVANGTATATVTVPAGFAVGTYAIQASYADTLNINGKVNYAPSTAAVPGTLTVKTADSQTTVVVTPGTIQFSPHAQSVTVTAQVTSHFGGIVNEGVVTFTLPGIAPVTVGVNSTGLATATLHLPPNFSIGSYLVTGTYVDTVNVNGNVSFASSSGTATLTVVPETVTARVQEVVIVPMGGMVWEFMTALVQTVDGPVQGGKATFNVNGLNFSGDVNSGQAGVLAMLPRAAAAEPTHYGVTYSPTTTELALTSEAELALLTLLNSFNFGYVLFGADGTQTVATIIDGIPVGLVYNANGQFVGFALGILPTPL
jgi:hypothetical protein